MYEYKKMTAVQKELAVAERKLKGYPWHSPPHFNEGVKTYIITAACYEHQEILTTASRLSEFSEALLSGVEQEVKGKIAGWVVLPNHYHLLADVDLSLFRPWIGRLHNRKATQWNREDNQLGRKVWYRFSDRKIRSEGHYYASLNYLHFNPVKHKYAAEAKDWSWSSVHTYLETLGRDQLNEWWLRFPLNKYGEGWDD